MLWKHAGIKEKRKSGDDLRRKIQDLAYARFQYEKPDLRGPGEELRIQALLGEENRGAFLLTSGNGIPLRGMVLSSHPRMRVRAPRFDGTQVTVGYEFDCEGLPEGAKEKGVFTVIYDGGEYSLPFVVSVTRFYAVTSAGTIRSLADFVKLAQSSWEEAYRIFTAPFFENVLLRATEEERRIYREVGGVAASMQGMEDFFLRTGKKQRVMFHLEEEERKLSQLFCDVKETVTVKKEGWGYLELTVSSDQDWLAPEKRKVTAEEFVGNTLAVEVLIKKDLLHGGNNLARLTLESGEDRQTMVFCVRGRAPADMERRLEQKRLLLRLMGLYLDFRMKKIVTGVWSKESCACLERLRELEPENLWYVLYHAQALLVNKQWQESKWVLQGFRREAVPEDSPLYAYYLYLCTLMETDASYVARTFGRIREIYQKNQEDARLFFVMLFLDPELLQSQSRKLAAIREKLEEGMNSPVLYMEAYYLISHDVYLLTRADGFERQILCWAVRKNLLTPKVAERVNKNMSRVRVFHPLWYQILKGCYRAAPDRELLGTLCGFCIKWNLTGAEQFAWFDEGVREDLKIAGLYEAWLESADLSHPEEIPRSVLLYFKYQNSVSSRKQALLYTGILKNRAGNPQLYEEYRDAMEAFSMEQFQAGQRGEYFQELYREFLPELARNRRAEAGPEHAYSWRGETGPEPARNRRAEAESEHVQGRQADACQAETESEVFARTGACQAETESEVLAQADVSVSEWIARADREISETNGEENEQLAALCAAIFRKGIYTERILWYLCRYFQGSLKEMERLWKAARTFELDTYELEERFLVQLLYTEGRTEAMEEIFEHYFEGHGQEMVLMAALSYFSYRYFVREEPVADGIFACIQRQILLGNPLNDCCRLACLRWLAKKGQPAGEAQSAEVRTAGETRSAEVRAAGETRSAEVRTAGETQSVEVQAAGNQYGILEELLEAYVLRGMYFAFYEELPAELKRRFILQDKTFLEYRTNPSHRVTVSYRLEQEDGALRTEEMEPVFEGIFVKSFVVFAGEEISYSIREEERGTAVLLHTTSGFIAGGAGEGRAVDGAGKKPEAQETVHRDDSRYGMLNRMTESYGQRDEESLKRLYRQYRSSLQGAERFRLL